MRSFVATPMRYGRLFLAGDAAHIVPPTGAKGLNLAMADVTVLAPALEPAAARQARPSRRLHATCLNRVWRSTHFSWWMTTMLHRTPGADAMETELQLSQLRYVVSPRQPPPRWPRITPAIPNSGSLKTRTDMRTTPPFRADHVGSLLRPQAVHDARAQFADGQARRRGPSCRRGRRDRRCRRHAGRGSASRPQPTASSAAPPGTWTSSTSSAASARPRATSR